MERVRRKLGHVALRGDQPTERGVDLIGADPGRVEETGALHQLDDRAPGGRQGAAALGVETRLGDAPGLDTHADAQQVAAGRATGRARVGRVGETPRPGGASRCSANERIVGATLPPASGEEPETSTALPRGATCSGERKPSSSRKRRRDSALHSPAPMTQRCAGLQAAEIIGPSLPLLGRELGLLSEQAWGSPATDHGRSRVGLPSRWCSAQHVRPAGVQARADAEATTMRAARLPP